MEVWIEPKLGVCAEGPPLFLGKDFLQIAAAYLNREHQIVTMEASFNRLKKDCQERSHWDEDSLLCYSEHIPAYNPMLQSSEHTYAVFCNRMFEYTLDETFRNRMNRLIYVPSTFDITLLLEHASKQRFHFSLLEPTPPDSNKANDANKTVMEQLREVLKLRNNIAIDLRRTEPYSQNNQKSLNAIVHAFVARMFNTKRMHLESESTMSEEEYDDDEGTELEHLRDWHA